MKEDKGYLAVRNLPDLKGKDFDKLIEEFDKNFKVCDHCLGNGFRTYATPNLQEGVQNFKYHKSPILSELKKKGMLNADKAKQIIEVILYDRKQCEECHGLGLIKKSRKKKDAKKVK